METIHKYPLDPSTILHLPREAQPLTVQLQRGVPMLWVKLNPETPTIARHFVSFGTGHTFDDTGTLRYLATFQLENGMVFHVFEARADEGEDNG